MCQSPNSLEQLLDQITETAERKKKISLGAILEAVGRRSFGSTLLVAGLIITAPIIGDIPGMPTIMGSIVVLTGVQLLIGRNHFWLPQWLLKRSLKQDHLCKAIGWLRKPSRFLDKYTKSRQAFLVQATGVRIIALVCILIAVALPGMELIPFSANGAGLAFSLFGLSLITNDGLLAVISSLVTTVTIGIVVANIF